jgi:type IV secretion system protein TrbL
MGSPFDQMTAALGSAFARIVGLLLTFWTASGGATDTSTAAGASIADRLGEYTPTLTTTAATIGVVIAGTRMAIASSRAQEPARDLLRGLMVLAFVWWAGVYLVRYTGDAFDEAGRHVLTTAGVNDTSAGNLESVLRSLAVSDAGLVFVLCLVGALSGLAQFLLLLLREPTLALLAGALPVAAGISVSGFGTAALRRLVAWTTAFTAYPFVAAVVYAAAFAVMSTAEDLGGVISGTALIIVGIAALPAMMRLVNPAVHTSPSRRAEDTSLESGLGSGALLLSGRGRQGAAGGPPSDAGPQTRPGLLLPSGSGLPALAAARGPGPGTPPTDGHETSDTRSRLRSRHGSPGRRPGRDDPGSRPRLGGGPGTNDHVTTGRGDHPPLETANLRRQS